MVPLLLSGLLSGNIKKEVLPKFAVSPKKGFFARVTPKKLHQVASPGKKLDGLKFPALNPGEKGIPRLEEAKLV